jgi:hypothetical protein
LSDECSARIAKRQTIFFFFLLLLQFHHTTNTKKNPKTKKKNHMSTTLTAPAATLIGQLRGRGVSDTTISKWLGYSGTRGSRDIGFVLGGTAHNIPARLASLRAAMAGHGTANTTPAAPPPGNGAPPGNAAAAAGLIARLRGHGVSDAKISAWLGYSGKNGPRDIDCVLRGTARNIPGRLASLRAAVARNAVFNAVVPPPAIAPPAVMPAAQVAPVVTATRVMIVASVIDPAPRAEMRGG